MAKTQRFKWPDTFTGTLRIGDETVSAPVNGILEVPDDKVALIPQNIWGFGFERIEDAAAPEEPVKEPVKDTVKKPA